MFYCSFKECPLISKLKFCAGGGQDCSAVDNWWGDPLELADSQDILSRGVWWPCASRKGRICFKIYFKVQLLACISMPKSIELACNHCFAICTLFLPLLFLFYCRKHMDMLPNVAVHIDAVYLAQIFLFLYLSPQLSP